MNRRVCTACLIVLSGLCVTWALGPANARAEDHDKKMVEHQDGNHDMSHPMLNADTVGKFKDSMDADMMKTVRGDLTNSGADLVEAHNAAVRYAAEKELMKDPEIKAKIQELAKDPEVMKMHKNDSMKMLKMIDDGKTRRQMMMEMAVRESCKEQMTMDKPASDSK